MLSSLEKMPSTGITINLKRSVSTEIYQTSALMHSVNTRHRFHISRTDLSLGYHRFQFYETVGGFSSEENCVSAGINHAIYGASTKLLLSVLQT